MLCATLLGLCATALHADSISASQAVLIARRWAEAHALTPRSATWTAHRLPRAYVLTSPQHFVVVSACHESPQVLGYGQRTSASTAMPAPLQALLQGQPQAVSAYPPSGMLPHPAVAPLLSTVRHQEAPYNAACPFYTDDEGNTSSQRCVVGCVATAMEQILTYHRLPITLSDTLHGWETPHYTVPDVLPGATVDTRLIADNYDALSTTPEQQDAVARLSFYLGMAAHMRWGLHESGAYSENLVEPLRRAFALQHVHYLDAYLYDPAAYWNYLADEIVARRPVYYAGSVAEGGGHAFVLDGLDADGLFHVNWGYGGHYDGYFRLDVLSFAQPADQRLHRPVGSGFLANHEAITLAPTDPGTVPPDTLSRTSLEVAVDSLQLLSEPLTGRLTPALLHLHNTTQQALHTTFALVENLPTDTAVYDQCVFLQYAVATLAPDEHTSLPVHLRLTREGNVVLHVTADAEHTLLALPLHVAAAPPQQVQASQPQVLFPAEGTAVICQQVSNASSEWPAGDNFFYEIEPADGGEAWRQSSYIYLPPATSRTDSLTFSSLRPGVRYTYRLRQQWPIVLSTTFVMPQGTGISTPTPPQAEAEATYYDLSGRRMQPHALPRGTVLIKRTADGSTTKWLIR